jgi:hypothetical protein
MAHPGACGKARVVRHNCRDQKLWKWESRKVECSQLMAGTGDFELKAGITMKLAVLECDVQDPTGVLQ